MNPKIALKAAPHEKELNPEVLKKWGANFATQGYTPLLHAP